MNIDFSSLISCVLHELDRIVKDASNIFFSVILKVVRSIDHAIILVVVIRVISSTINNMSQSKLLERFLVSGDQVTSQEKETVDDLRADHLEELILVLFPRSTLVIEVFIV